MQVQSVVRQLIAETAVALERFVISMLWDVEKFFDTIIPEYAIDAARNLDFPKEALGLAMVMHRAPRIIVCDGCAADPIGATSRSILAGCVTSTSLARGLLRETILGVGNGEGHWVFQHVDDLTQLTVADTLAEAVIKASKKGEHIGKGIERLGHRVSAKSEVVASTALAAEMVARNLMREGIKVKLAKVAVDVGVSTAAGRKRAVAAQNQRLDKADARSRKVKHLVAANKRAMALHKTGTAPQASYGATVQGASPSQIVRHRRQAVRACPNVGPQPCTTAILHWMMGPSVDPFVQLVRKQAEHWIKAWRCLTTVQRKETREAWKLWLPRALLAKEGQTSSSDLLFDGGGQGEGHRTEIGRAHV